MPIEVIMGHNDTVTSRVRKISVKGDVRVPAFLNVLSINNKAVTTDYLSRVSLLTSKFDNVVLSKAFIFN